VRIALIVALMTGVLSLHARGAGAHAIVLESVPARDAVLEHAPGRLVLRFNSKIEKRLSRITIAAGRGVPAPLAITSDGPDSAGQPDRLVAPLPPLGPGAYAVRYKVLSADGHITEGILRFTVTGGRP
jgi:methionine-rich copper-binding protein CopC